MKHSPLFQKNMLQKVYEKIFITHFPEKIVHFICQTFWWPFFNHWPLFSNFSFPGKFPIIPSYFPFLFNFPPVLQVPPIFQMFLHSYFLPLNFFTFPSPKLAKTNAKFPPKMGMMKISASFPPWDGCPWVHYVTHSANFKWNLTWWPHVGIFCIEHVLWSTGHIVFTETAHCR